MVRQGFAWLACVAVGFGSLTIDPQDAEAGRRRAWRQGYYGGYAGGGCCGGGYAYQNWQPAAGCCAAVATTHPPVSYQAAATYQPAGNACLVQPVNYQTYDHTTGYAPQGTMQPGQQQAAPPPPPNEQFDEAPRTFRQAPEAAPLPNDQ